MLKIAIIDCQDSFVYNLVEIMRHQPHCIVDIWRYDALQLDASLGKCEGAITLGELVSTYDGLLLSPGPGHPEEFPLLLELIKQAKGHCAIFGVCLGMQAIAVSFGGALKQLVAPLHGFGDHLKGVRDCFLFDAIPSEATIGRYHSWVIDEASLPEELEVVAYAQADGEPMVLSHKWLPLVGVQFHPESYIATSGEQYLVNWLNKTRLWQKEKGKYGY